MNNIKSVIIDNYIPTKYNIIDNKKVYIIDNEDDNIILPKNIIEQRNKKINDYNKVTNLVQNETVAEPKTLQLYLQKGAKLNDTQTHSTDSYVQTVDYNIFNAEIGTMFIKDNIHYMLSDGSNNDITEVKQSLYTIEIKCGKKLRLVKNDIVVKNMETIKKIISKDSKIVISAGTPMRIINPETKAYINITLVNDEDFYLLY
jgi:hypothetical protein